MACRITTIEAVPYRWDRYNGRLCADAQWEVFAVLTILMLGAICVAVLVVLCFVAGIVLTLVGLPLALLFGALPWLLRLVGVVLLFKALFEKPTRWENFMPAVIAFGLSWLLRWF